MKPLLTIFAFSISGISCFASSACIVAFDLDQRPGWANHIKVTCDGKKARYVPLLGDYDQVYSKTLKDLGDQGYKISSCSGEDHVWTLIKE